MTQTKIDQMSSFEDMVSVLKVSDQPSLKQKQIPISSRNRKLIGGSGFYQDLSIYDKFTFTIHKM